MSDPPSSPQWADLEERIISEVTTGLERLREAAGDEPLAAVVLWAAPYKGWYELLADTAERNREGARERNQRWQQWFESAGKGADDWKTARTTAQRTQALDYDPRHGKFAFADDPVHTFEVSFADFVRSPRYAELNQGGEDGWLEGHVRFVLTRALTRMARDGAFDALPRVSPLRVGYAYADWSEALFVALVA